MYGTNGGSTHLPKLLDSIRRRNIAKRCVCSTTVACSACVAATGILFWTCLNARAERHNMVPFLCSSANASNPGDVVFNFSRLLLEGGLGALEVEEEEEEEEEDEDEEDEDDDDEDDDDEDDDFLFRCCCCSCD